MNFRKISERPLTPRPFSNLKKLLELSGWYYNFKKITAKTFCVTTLPCYQFVVGLNCMGLMRVRMCLSCSEENLRSSSTSAPETLNRDRNWERESLNSWSTLSHISLIPSPPVPSWHKNWKEKNALPSFFILYHIWNVFFCPFSLVFCISLWFVKYTILQSI